MPLRTLLPLLAVLLTSPSLAATPRPPTVAVLDTKATGAFDPKTVTGLSSFIPAEAARHRVRVVSGSDLRALLGLERERQLLGCTESTCLAEIGGALGTEFLLTSEVSEVGGVWLLTFTLLDVKRALAVERVARRTSRTSELVDLASAGVAEALARFDGPKPAAPAAQTGGGVRTGGIVVGVAGALAVAGGGVAGFLAQSAYQDGEAAVAAGDAQALSDAKGAAKSRMDAANVLYGAGAAALAAGVLMIVFGGPETPVAVTPVPGGASVTLQGRF